MMMMMSQSQNPSHSESPSQSLWGIREPSSSPDKNDAYKGEALPLSPSAKTESQAPIKQSLTVNSKPVDIRLKYAPPNNVDDSVPAGFRRIRGVVATARSYPSTRPTRQQHNIATRPRAASVNKSKSNCCSERRVSKDSGRRSRDDYVASGHCEGLSHLPGGVGSADAEPEVTHSVKPKDRAESRVQRLCKVKYTRASFRNRPTATNTGSRLDRLTKKRSRFADSDAESKLEQKKHVHPCERAEDDNVSDQSCTPAGSSHNGMQPTNTPNSCNQADRLAQSADEASLGSRQVAEATSDAWDWQAWESSGESSADEDEKNDEESSVQEYEDDDQDDHRRVVDQMKRQCNTSMGDRSCWDEREGGRQSPSSSLPDRPQTDSIVDSDQLGLLSQEALAAQPQSHLARPSRNAQVAPKPARAVSKPKHGLSSPRRVQTRSSSQRRSQRNCTPPSLTTTSVANVDPWRMSLTTGSRLDAMDSWGKWYEGVVVDTKQGHVNNCAKLAVALRIHFMTWSPRYQEWFDIRSESLQPLNTHPHSPNGDAPDYVPPEALTAPNDGCVGTLTAASKAAKTKTGCSHKRQSTRVEGDQAKHKAKIMDFHDTNDGCVSDEAVSDAHRSPRSTGSAALRLKRKASPIVPRRRKSPESMDTVKRAKRQGNGSSVESWVVGGRWDIARCGQLNATTALSDQFQDHGGIEALPAVGHPTSREGAAEGAVADSSARAASTTPNEARARKGPSKNQVAIDAANLASKNRSPCAACDECGNAQANAMSKAAASSDAAAAHTFSPGRTLCGACAKRRAYIKSRTKMGTVVARVTRRTSSADKPSPVRQRPRRKKKLFDGIEFCFVDGSSGRTAAADAARDLLASQIRSCGGMMVSLTPKHVRGIDHRAIRLMCLASSPKKTPEYMLALAIGATPLSVEWPARCMQDESLLPNSGFQLPPLRVPGSGTGAGTGAPACARNENGRILPMERRVLRTAKGRDPLLLAVRASSKFAKQWYVKRSTATTCNSRLTLLERTNHCPLHNYATKLQPQIACFAGSQCCAQRVHIVCHW